MSSTPPPLPPSGEPWNQPMPDPGDPWNQPTTGPTAPGPQPGAGQPAPGYGPPPTNYGAPGYGQPYYGQPQYGSYGPAQIEHPQGTTILVLGILGILFCALLAPVAWVMGNTALREIDAQPGRYSNRGIVQAGRLCGMIYSIFLIVLVVGAFVLIALAGVNSSN